MNERETPMLSSEGRARREAMLGELVVTMDRIHRRHRARRRTVACAGIVLLIASLAVLALSPAQRRPREGTLVRDDDLEEPITVPVGVEPTESGPRDWIVHTDPAILQRVAVTPTVRILRVDDDGLLDMLAAMNRPTGLIRCGGRVRLTAEVVDPISTGGDEGAPGSSL